MARVPTRRTARVAPWLVSLLALAILGAGAAAVASELDGDRALEQGRFAEAVEAYGAAVERGTTNASLLIKHARATTYQADHSDDPAEAERLFALAAERARTAIERHPEVSDTHLELARALGRLGQFRGVLQSLGLAEEVRGALRTALELDPDNADVLHALALWHLEVPWILGGRSGEVAPLFERAIELEPRAITHRVAFAEALLRLGDREAARAQLEAALDLRVRTFLEREDRAHAEELMASEF